MKQSLMHIALVVRDYERIRSVGIEFAREPAEMSYGTVAILLRWPLAKRVL